jgi:hypothetical protein
MMQTRLVALSALSLIAALGTAACDEALDAALDTVATENEEAQNAVDSMQQGSLEAAVLASIMDPVMISADIPAMIAEAEAALATTFTPADCVTSTVAADTMNVVFQDCNGPYGLDGITGGANLSLNTATEAETQLNLAGAGLQVNGATIGLGVTGSATTNGDGNRAYDLITAGTGLTRDNTPVGRAGNFTMTVEGECLVMQGAWTFTIQTDVRAATFNNFKRCDTTCPDSGSMAWAGGEATSEDLASAVGGLALTFVGGGNTVSWVQRNAGGGTTPGVTRLVCEAQ